MSSKIDRFKVKKIAILGLGIENISLMRFLIDKNIDCEMTVCDARKKKELGDRIDEFKNQANIKWQLGKEHDKYLADFDIVSRIAGYPLFTREIKKAIQAEVEITSPTKLFFEFCPTKNIIGVTGTKGKGTTSGLIYNIFSTAGKNVYWGGNIGIPMFGFINKLKKTDWVVLELSSFQLEDMTVSPKYALITNLSQEHLAPADPANPNYHKTMENYILAKLNIVKWQKSGDFAILNKKTQLSPASARRGKYNLGRGKKIYFTSSDLPSRLPGEHNQENAAAAVKLTKLIGIRGAVIKKAVKKFKGLEHRLEFVGEKNMVRYYDDSFATTPESTIVALHAFQEPIILLAGGAEKDSKFKKLAQEIKKQVKYLILLDGKATSRLKKELVRIGYAKEKMELAKSMKSAVSIAGQKAKPSDIILLSPACASFGMFHNYKERGDLFKKEVKKFL